MVNAGTWRGRTLSESLRFTVAIVVIPRRSATATSEASVPPNRSMCCVGAIRQRHDDVGVYQNHDGRSAAKAVGQQLVHPLGEVVASTVEAPDERRQRSATGVGSCGTGLRNRLDCA